MFKHQGEIFFFFFSSVLMVFFFIFHFFADLIYFGVFPSTFQFLQQSVVEVKWIFVHIHLMFKHQGEIFFFFYSSVLMVVFIVHFFGD